MFAVNCKFILFKSMNAKATVLYLSYDGLTDQLGQSQILPYLKALAATYHIIIISAEKIKLNSATINDLQIHLKAFDIEWIPTSYTKNPPVISTIWDFVKMWKIASQQKNVALVHCRSYLPALLALKYKKKIRVPFLFDMRGFWADERVEGNIWSLKNVVYRQIYFYFKNLEKELLKEADHIISLTYKAKEILKEKFNVQENKISVIPCCADTDLFNTTSFAKSDIKNELQIPLQANVLAYLGSIGTWYMLDEMLLFYKQILSFDTSCQFLFITKENAQLILNRARHLNVPVSNIKIISATRNQVVKYLSIVDLGISFIKPSYSKQASSPVKLGEMLSSGIPMICNTGVGDVDKTINESCGLLVDANEASHLLINELQWQRLLSLDKSKISAYAERIFSLSNGIAAYQTVYQQLIYGDKIHF